MNKRGKKMRITKAMIYNKYGIKYDPKTQKIETPLGLSKELLRKGNKKIGKNVYQWSMNTSTCACKCEDCYGTKGCYCFPSVQKCLAMNTDIARHYLDFFKRAIIAQLSTLKDGTEIRIHVVGDFFSLEYVMTWHEIIEMFPNLVFWTYTKTKHENAFNDLDNANIVKSLVDGKLNFGKCSHVMELYEDLKAKGKSVHICKCGVDDEQHCEGCHMCSLSEYVLFLEHSTSYDAKADALYPAFVEMVNNQ